MPGNAIKHFFTRQTNNYRSMRTIYMFFILFTISNNDSNCTTANASYAKYLRSAIDNQIKKEYLIQSTNIKFNVREKDEGAKNAYQKRSKVFELGKESLHKNILT